jgi:hypothetical protein
MLPDDDDDDDEDHDPELLLHIPFTEAVTVHSIAVRSVTNNHNNHNNNHNPITAAPRTLKLFVNRDVLDCDTAREAPAEATYQLLPPDHYVEGTIDYPLRPAGRFQNISSLQLFVADNYSTMPPVAVHHQQQQQGNNNATTTTNEEDEHHGRVAPTEITYIGLKGQGTKMRRVAVEAVYESQGMPKDHKTPSDEYTTGHFVD